MQEQHPYAQECDEHWSEVMKLAEQYGFIVQAYAGTAILFSHAVQLEQGLNEYLRIQKMNGHCPKDFGYAGCVDSQTGVVQECGSCCLLKKKGRKKS